MRTALLLVGGIALATGCRTSYPDIPFPDVPLSSGFVAESTHTVAVYVHPSGSPKHDHLFGNLITLDLLSRGYTVKDVNAALSPGRIEQLVKVRLHAPLVDSLRVVPEVRAADALLVANLVVKQSTRSLQYGRVYPYAFTAKGKISLCSIPDGRTIASRLFIDTANVLRFERFAIAMEQNRFVLERGLNRVLGDLPIRAGSKEDRATLRIPVTMYVDNSFRDRFPTDWRERVARRMLFVNDIYVPQTGIYLDVREITEWQSWFSEDLEDGFGRLHASIEPGPWLSIGISFDNMLGRENHRGHYVGLGSFVTASGIMTVVPTLPGLGPWNSLDDACILAHEIGHILGLPHVRDPRSIMFPTASTMSVAFDSVSLRMLKTFSRDLLRLSPEDRCRRRLLALNAWHQSGQARRIQYVATIHNDLSSLWKLTKGIALADTVKRIDTAEGRTLAMQYVTDPLLREALLGAIDTHHERWEPALARFKDIVDAQPDFMEVYDYLLYIYGRQGEFGKVLSLLRDIEKLDPTWMSDL